MVVYIFDTIAKKLTLPRKVWKYKLRFQHLIKRSQKPTQMLHRRIFRDGKLDVVT
jgi:hypothetical protein